MDKNIIPKKTYRAIYRLLDSVSPADFDCGQLCGAVCCLSESDDMGIYLLPGEERCVNFRDSDGGRQRLARMEYTKCGRMRFSGILGRTGLFYKMQNASLLRPG